jgi:4-amino-4-deoxy-L-arabinose transferase-like glycosyltransferase
MPETKFLSLRDLLLLALMAFALLAPGISSLPPTDRDESRYAVATSQMVETGDFIDIHFQDEPRHLQPIGIYWLQSATVALFSSPEAKQIWAFRLPSLVAAVAASLVAGAAAAGFLGRRAGFPTAALTAASFSLAFEAHNAKIDATLLLAVTCAQLALMRAYLGNLAQNKPNAAVFWIAMAAGVLLKGPIIVIVVGATAAALVVWDRKAAWLMRLEPLWGFPLMLLIVVPWYVAIGYATDGEFFARAIGKNMLHKVGNSQQGHTGPFGYHLALFGIMFWPGALFAALAAPFAWRKRNEPVVRFLLCWILPSWMIFEIIATKLPHYVLPIYPGLAMLAAAMLLAPPEPEARKWPAWLGWVWAGVWLVFSAIVTSVAPAAVHYFAHKLDPLSIALGLLGFAACCVALFFVRKRAPKQAVGAAVAAAFLTYVNIYAYSAPRLGDFWMSPRISAAVNAVRPCERSPLVTAPYHEPSLVFLYGWSDVRLATSPELAAEFMSNDVECSVALIGEDRKAAFLSEAARRGLALRDVGELQGRNYSDGDHYDLTLYRASAP